ncbi:hypothetical protein COLO4_24746 [Corchorus olitorius]|uniref:Uncharacterized protein n=1 Tax=Corchorus olitorius TaxID=93759 RepID=A0A1R3I7C5_9ROSI|nr:hypothetical protein COLO4_24746 [Corchorus olitorius]
MPDPSMSPCGVRNVLTWAADVAKWDSLGQPKVDNSA